MRNIFLLFVLLSCVFGLSAQDYPISTGSIQDCGGFLVDNGLSSSDYGPNENSTSTICQDGTGSNLVNLYFASFSLGAGDVVTIYDGSDMGAPLLGTFTGQQLQGMDVYSTNNNGCLTVHFTSDGDESVGNFGAEISCALPCDRPVPVVTANQLDFDPIRLCIGETITLDASGSTFAEGTQLGSFTWDFSDGTENTDSWPTVSHSFTEPGAYVVELALTDNTGCASGILLDMLIFVATEPEISISANDYQVCVGQEVDLSSSVVPVTWSALPDANFGGALYIPDDQSQCFTDELVFGGFEPGSTISSATDLEYFFINFEHTFMGDLVISFICPNGQSIIAHQQNGGGTHLGQSNEEDNENLPGVGWDYYWAPDATLGTWSEEANNGYTMDNGTGLGIQALIPDTYSTVDPFSNLIGCPLNGTWTVEVCDMWGADDGFIFDWSVAFADYLYPELISFTPSFGAGCDSTFWSGQFITNDGGACDMVSAVPTEEGTFTYTYTAIDNHGCTYTNEFTVNAFPGPIPDAGLDAPFCGDPVELNGAVTNPVEGINYLYNWTPGAPLSGSSTNNPTVNFISEETTFTFSVQPSNDPLCIVSDEVTLFIPEPPLSTPIDSLEYCAGSDYELQPPISNEAYNYSWSYSANIEGPYEVVQSSGMNHAPASTGYYELLITEPVCNFSSSTPYYVELFACNIKLPNVFTPNGDGDNDALVILGLENFPKSSIEVFNRWGGLVYEDDDYQNDWSPRDLSEGTYFFVLGLNEGASNKKYYESHLTLLRK
jgi:gliding motility-associated-like protein